MPALTEGLVEAKLSRLAHAWNIGSAGSWGAEFTSDAQFVTVFGQRLSNRREIEQRLFDPVLKDSTCAFKLVDVRLLAPTVMVAHSTAVARIPAGPLTGERTIRQTMILVQDALGNWLIADLHNTLVAADR
jgi:uncharacterized protein (TIGR02246 family)